MPIKRITAITIMLLLVTSIPFIVQAQTSVPFKPVATQPVEVTDKPTIRSAVLKAATVSQKKGDIKRSDLVRLRVAMFSPAFQKKVEDLAVIQISASGEDGPFETSETGEIIRETINWDGLLAFLEKLIPIILSLLSTFGA